MVSVFEAKRGEDARWGQDFGGLATRERVSIFPSMRLSAFLLVLVAVLSLVILQDNTQNDVQPDTPSMKGAPHSANLPAKTLEILSSDLGRVNGTGRRTMRPPGNATAVRSMTEDTEGERGDEERGEDKNGEDKQSDRE
ncbi:hypothetical protein BV25DRAFT_1921857 [Artomyces pyxidatus]|uniref:Uncharacterized protein n=1 Tax=Artomyces pyxidatus TaxID=48021 RepID=A0ACB8SGN0_9AGAM|nr:hypothetical protein BV25DRAFT_1921857 [Artomyces pyxidatus]